MPDVQTALAEAARRLSGDSARFEAELLLLHVLERPRVWLYTHADDVLGATEAAAFAALVQRRSSGEPVAYLTGRRGFWSLDLAVTTATLIPRPETELLVELALQRIPLDEAFDIADLGTGSGAIALAIASERPLARLWATDASAEALRTAQANAAHMGLRNVQFVLGDWCAALGGAQMDLIVSNPPYIAAGDPHLERGDLRFEPRSALASGADGLDDIRRIVIEALSHLKPGASLLFEHGQDQGQAVRELLSDAGYLHVATGRDLEGRDRVTDGTAP
jgi:release factor glutamine methyltransferase